MFWNEDTMTRMKQGWRNCAAYLLTHMNDKKIIKDKVTVSIFEYPCSIPYDVTKDSRE